MGLTWSVRFFGTDFNNDLAMWVAVQPTAGTNVITIPLDGFNQNWTYAWAVSGADTTTPFDSHAGLPAVNPNGPANLSANYSTSNADDFIYILNRGTGTPTGTPALTTMFNDASGTFGGYYYIASTPQSSVTATSPVNTNYILADATVQAAVTGSSVWTHPTLLPTL